MLQREAAYINHPGEAEDEALLAKWAAGKVGRWQNGPVTHMPVQTEASIVSDAAYSERTKKRTQIAKQAVIR